MNKQTLYITSLQTIVTQEIRRFTRIWIQTLLPPVITMTLYFVIFGRLIGARIGDMGGYSYMEFMVPGLIMMSVITNAYSNVASSLFSKRFQNSIEELLVSPTPSFIILTGFVIGGLSRGAIVAAIVSAVSLFFTSLNVAHPLLMILVAVMASMLFSFAGFINALLARNFDDVSIIPTFILTPMIYLGGVFYSIELLPDFWQAVSQFNPILYIVNSFRYTMLGVSDVDVTLSILALVAFNLLGWFTCLYLLKTGKGLRK